MRPTPVRPRWPTPRLLGTQCSYTSALLNIGEPHILEPTHGEPSPSASELVSRQNPPYVLSLVVLSRSVVLTNRLGSQVVTRPIWKRSAPSPAPGPWPGSICPKAGSDAGRLGRADP